MWNFWEKILIIELDSLNRASRTATEEMTRKHRKKSYITRRRREAKEGKDKEGQKKKRRRGAGRKRRGKGGSRTKRRER